MVVTKWFKFVAVCKTSKDSCNKPNEKCVFPFKYKGRTFDKCTTYEWYPKTWCATKVDANGNFISGEWGECNSKKCEEDTSKIS